METSGRSRVMLDVVATARGRIEHKNLHCRRDAVARGNALVRLGRVTRALSM